MGNHSSSHAAHKTRKNVHWKSAGRPTAPGKPDIIPLHSDDEPNAITLKWAPPTHDGGAPLRGYQVECNRLGSIDWVRTAPPVVLRPELLLTGLEPPHRYQFRVAAINAVGRSEYSELSDVLTVNSDSPVQHPPIFHQHIENVTALENDKTEFRVTFSGSPAPTIAWFKDDYEIFSSRRTTISTNESSSVLVFYQTLSSDEGEIKCTATNRAGHAVSKARLSLEAAPKLRYPRQYEDGLLYEINETVFLKTTIVGKPTPVVEWRHDGQPLIVDDRVQITNTPKFSMLKIISARRSDRGEYQIHAKNNIGEDTAAFLVTVTAPPDAPRNVRVTRQVDKSVTLDWEPPDDDGGCRIGNYVVEYYRSGWNVWLKATTSRKTNVTLFDLIEGSEYKFRVKAESPYGMSAPSKESAPVKIPGRSVDMEFLAVESRIINESLTKEGGEELPVSPAPRRKRAAAYTAQVPAAATASPTPLRKQKRVSVPSEATSNEFMLVLYPDNEKSNEKAEKRKSFQLDLEDSLSPPPISLSAPELSSRCAMPFKPLRNAVSSTELLHERAMDRFYKAVALKEQQKKQLDKKSLSIEQNHIPYTNSIDKADIVVEETTADTTKNKLKTLEVLDKSESLDIKYEDIKLSPAPRQDSISSDKWQHMSFDEDYTASTVSTDGDYTDEEDDSLNEELEREGQLMEEEETYNPRNKITRPSSTVSEPIEEEEEPESKHLKPLSLPDPNFVPKPILKKRESDAVDIKTMEPKTITEDKFMQTKQKKDDKINLFSKITKQKPFSFPKMLSKKQTDKPSQQNAQVNEEKLKVKSVDDKFSDEGKTVIDYYGNIVKEYGSHKKTITPLYLNTDDLKQVAEKQTKEDIKKHTVAKKKKVVKKVSENNVKSIKIKGPKSSNKQEQHQMKQHNLERQKITSNKEKFNSTITQHTTEKPQPNETRVLLKTTERATVVIPIDYKKMEERAKVNVRSAIDYTVDVCLLLLAFWVYFFKDERLAIPLLILIIYRQVQETIAQNIPEWINLYMPQWMKKKTS